MEPLAVLVVLLVFVGVVSELLFRDAARASLAAALVSSLAIALSLTAVMACFERVQGRRRHRRFHTR